MSWPLIAGAAISSMGDIGSALIGNNNSGAHKSRKLSRDLWLKNYKAQREFAKYGIQWRVADAKAAGINPLAALGGGSFAPSNPVHVGTSGGSPMSEKLENMGQNIGRAVASMETKAEKEVRLLRIEQEKAKLENMKLQNIGLKKEIDEVKGPLNTVQEWDIPIASEYVTVTDPGVSANYVPSQVTKHSKPGVQGGIHAQGKYILDYKQRLHHSPTQQWSEPAEDIYGMIKKAALSVKDHYEAVYFRYHPLAKNWPQAKAHRKWLRSQREKCKDPNYQFRYDAVWNLWQKTRRTKGNWDRLYVGKNPPF